MQAQGVETFTRGAKRGTIQSGLAAQGSTITAPSSTSCAVLGAALVHHGFGDSARVDVFALEADEGGGRVAHEATDLDAARFSARRSTSRSRKTNRPAREVGSTRRGFSVPRLTMREIADGVTLRISQASRVRISVRD